MNDLNDYCQHLISMGNWVGYAFFHIFQFLVIAVNAAMCILILALLAALYGGWGRFLYAYESMKDEKPWKRPFGIAHGVATVGVLLLSANLLYLLSRAIWGAKIHVYSMDNFSWILTGISGILIVGAAISIGPRIVYSGFLAKKMQDKIIRISAGIIISAVVLLASIVPFMTSTIEIACASGCHQQFVQSIKQDETTYEKYESDYEVWIRISNSERDKPTYTSNWAMDYFRMTCILDGIGALFVLVFAIYVRGDHKVISTDSSEK